MVQYRLGLKAYANLDAAFFWKRLRWEELCSQHNNNSVYIGNNPSVTILVLINIEERYRGLKIAAELYKREH